MYKMEYFLMFIGGSCVQLKEGSLKAVVYAFDH